MANEFINTFQNGMNQDSNPYFQPEGTYRFANNLQLINHDGNNLTLKDALGNRNIVLLDVPFATSSPTLQADTMPLAFISFPDKLIVFHSNNETDAGSGGEIGQMFLTNIGESIEAEDKTILTYTFSGYVPLYYHESLNFSKVHKIEGFGFSENDEINRVYWTDNNNEPRVFNITNPIFTTYITSGTLVAGKQYMVIAGMISYNDGVTTTAYGKGLATGNVFTATTGFNTYSIVPNSGNVLVIEYFPYQLLAWTPSRALGNMRFVEYGTGVKKCGSNVYFYRLGIRSEGYFTSWSYGSNPIHVGVQNDTVFLIAPYQNFVGNGNQSTVVTSDKSVKLLIDNIDTNFDVIQIACAEYAQLYTTPFSLSIVQEATITGSTMTLEDFGNINLGTLTLDDITLFPASILKCKTITTNKNYNVIANITERTQPEFDRSTVTISSFEYPMNVHGDDGSGSGACTTLFVLSGTVPTVNANPAAGSITPFSRWLVTNGNLTTDTVSYNGVFYVTGEVITGVNSLAGVNPQNTITFTGSGAVRPCVSVNKYTTAGGTNRLNTAEIKTLSWDYKDPLVAEMCKGYWSHETYRFGIMFYDLKGNPFFVEWLGDYQMPLIQTKNGLMRQDQYNGVAFWSLNPSGVKFSGIRITAETAGQISGFSIVRAPRDVRIVTQGLMMQNNVHTSGGVDIVTPLFDIQPTFGPSRAMAPNIWAYICPDGLVSFPQKSDIGVIDDILEEATWVNGVQWSGAYIRSGNSPEDGFAKLFLNFNDPSSAGILRQTEILGWQNINDSDYVSNVFGISGTDYRNYDILFDNAANVIETNCTGPGGTQSLNGRRAVGAKKFIVYASDVAAAGQYPSGYGYTDGASTPNPGNNPYKLLMNYCKNKTNLYGGTGETALANTFYISTGHFQPINASVLADTLTAGGYYEFNNVEVFGGDCFTNLVSQGYILQDTVSFPANTYSLGLYFPCECNSNYGLRRGRKIENVAMGTGGASAVGVSWSPTRLEEYSYNPAYSSEGAQFLYPALPVDFLNTNRFPTLMRFAGQKIIGEIIDSFRTFLINDRLFVDVQLGEINNLKAKGDYVYYWQNKGVGSAPILERQMISATAGAATSLGTGGVLSRFDTISTKYGNQHQWGLTDTEYGWIWFDMRNKDVCIMGFGGAVQEITVPTGMKSFFGEVFNERLTAIFNGTYLNSQTYDASSDRPLIGTGIIGVYDPKNKMSYLTFKFRSYYKSTNEPIDYSQYQIINKDFTIGFSHVLNKFVGFYDKTPAIWHNHGQMVLSANNPKNLNKYYATDMVLPTPFSKGDVFAKSDGEYIFLQDETLSAYPASVNIQRINRTNEIYIENEEKEYTNVVLGYKYNESYGRIVNNELEVIVTPKVGQMSVTNCELGSTGNCFTDLTVSADNNQTAQDADIAATNRNFKYFDGSWWFNLPLSSLKGRITDKYMKMRFKKKNWSSNPTVNDNRLTVWQYLKSFIERKR